MIPNWLFQSLGSVKSLLIVNLASRSIYLCLCFLLNWLSSPIEYLIFFNFIGWLVAFYISRHMLKDLGIQITFIFNFQKSILFFNEILQYYTSRLSVIIYTYLNVIIVGAFLTPVNIAFYGLSEQLYKIIQGVTGSVNQAIYPILTKDKIKKTFYLAIFFIFFIGISLMTLIQIYALPFVEILYGPQYIDIVPLIKMFSFLALINSINVMFGFPAAAIFGVYKLVNLSSHFAAAAYLFSLAILFYLEIFDIFNLIICLTIAELTSLLIRLFGLFISVKK
jgi:O-antigen/teichoic acid export membrane protein